MASSKSDLDYSDRVAGSATAGDRGVEVAELIARLESATGPSRELDCLIYATLSWPRGNWEIAQVANDRLGEMFFDWTVLRRTAERYIILHREVPHYTSSPYDSEISLHHKITSVLLLGDGRFEATALDEGGNYHKGAGATEAIARHIAVLRARVASAKARAA